MGIVGTTQFLTLTHWGCMIDGRLWIMPKNGGDLVSIGETLNIIIIDKIVQILFLSVCLQEA